MELITTKSYENIIEVAKKVEKDRGDAEYLDRGCAYYEAGMTEVLRKMAEAIYFGTANRPSSKEAIKASHHADNLHNELRGILSEEHHGLLLDYDDACRNWGATHGADEFINGFVAAYRFFNKN